LSSVTHTQNEEIANRRDEFTGCLKATLLSGFKIKTVLPQTQVRLQQRMLEDMAPADATNGISLLVIFFTVSLPR